MPDQSFDTFLIFDAVFFDYGIMARITGEKKVFYEIHSSKYLYNQKPLMLMKIGILRILSKIFGLIVYERNVISDIK